MAGFEGIALRPLCEVSLPGVVHVLMCVHFEAEGILCCLLRVN